MAKRRSKTRKSRKQQKSAQAQSQTPNKGKHRARSKQSPASPQRKSPQAAQPDDVMLSTVDWHLLDLEQAVHLPGCIQPHGVLLACEPEHLTIRFASDNTEQFFEQSATQLLGQTLKQVFPQAQFVKITNVLQESRDRISDGANRLVEWTLNREESNTPLHILIHRNVDDLILLEIIPSLSSTPQAFLNFYQTVRDAAHALQKAPDFETLCQRMTQEVADLTGFDRVMVYQFDDQWNGEVIAETCKSELIPMLGLHFPDADTRPCRLLYGDHWSRMIANVNGNNVNIVPPCHRDTDMPLDLSHSIVRGFSPCHQEYLQNMEVGASLVLSIIYNNRLWGLVSCHHSTTSYFSYEVQQACEFLSQVFSVELGSKRQQQNYDYHIQLKNTQAQLVEQLTQQDDFRAALLSGPQTLMNLFNASGVAVFWQNQLQTLGTVPEEPAIADLIDWLDEQDNPNLFTTEQLGQVYPPAVDFKTVASGLLAIKISSQNYLLWFRPEILQTVNWAGNPDEIVMNIDDDGLVRLSPRGSFAVWQETLQGHSLPWQSCEIEVAQDFRQGIINIVLSQAAALKELTQELARSNAELERFAYIASHDLQEPLNLVGSYVQLLEMRYADELDQDAREFINFAVEGVGHMQALIDDLLAYSRVETRGESFKPVHLSEVLTRVLNQLRPRLEERQTQVNHEPLPTVWGDNIQLTQLLQNLLANSLKFCQTESPDIQIRARELPEQWQLSIQDNGIGIEDQFHERIFLIFQRLHTRDEYPGTGIGLAICKKIVERHGGRIWVESKLGQGATFHLTLPKVPEPDDSAS
ncbi:MAG: GAF domain-containing protein [Spirulina sp. SIO3F2]|nr:GAF domain-containing protein [Spirulina sp. SIO3F2]